MSIINKILFEAQSPSIKITNDEDRTLFTIKDIGSIVVEEMTECYWYFEDDFTEDEYKKMFPDERVFKIEHLGVKDKYMGKGFAKTLMNKVISYAKQKGYDSIYLNASPMGHAGLNSNDLVEFYKSFGFEVILNQGHNSQMLLKF